ncbi:hypothetical protein [Burkholderia seminalis]|uniref:hypothetical protein n=1 Tax=Burkholderia seminalis TaxID=488731 RepID=UPI003F51A662
MTESVAHFNAQVEWARNLMLGMLGHDMRTPLQTILPTASYLASLNAGETVTNARSVTRTEWRQDAIAAGRLV